MPNIVIPACVELRRDSQRIERMKQMRFTGNKGN